MVRSLRIEYPGAVYHVTSRGDRREPIAVDDADRLQFFAVLTQAFERFDAHAWAYCLMGNHYHLVLRTRQSNLSRLMRHINGVYTQCFNRRHNLVGHLFQGRFKAILVDTESHLLEVCRYVDLNPVRAHMVEQPDAYPWSSYRALAGLDAAPAWLDYASVYAQLSPNKSEQHAAIDYAQFVAQGHGVRLWQDALRQQIYLGDDAFVTRMQGQLNAASAAPDALGEGTTRRAKSANVSKIQSSAPPLDHSIETFLEGDVQGNKDTRNRAMVNAFYKGGHTQTAIAQAFGISGSTVSRVISAAKSTKDV